jgi:hypothetical protein
MAGKGGGLFAVMGPPAAEDDDDFSDDALPAEDEEEMPELGAGPFEAYAETVFDPAASVEEKTEALRQALLTLIEERGA